MAPPFSCCHPLIDDQGNFGSSDDPTSCAAIRCTGSRLTPIAEVLLGESGHGTVDCPANLDGTLEDPHWQPALLPHRLLNRTTGIAAGMATDLPPHTPNEVVSACTRLRDDLFATSDLQRRGQSMIDRNAFYPSTVLLTAQPSGVRRSDSGALVQGKRAEGGGIKRGGLGFATVNAAKVAFSFGGNMRNVVVAVLLLTISTVSVAKRAPNAADVVAQIESQVEQGNVDPASDLAPLVDGLRAAKDDASRSRYISAIEALGDSRGSAPAAVKAWLVQNAPPALLEVARSNAGWSVRGDALMALRSLDAPDAVLDEAIGIARAATGDAAGFLHSRGSLLQDWKENRERSGHSSVATPTDPQKEQAALEFLRTRSYGVSSDDLGRALGSGDVEVVRALIDAGIDVSKPGDMPLTPLGMATMLACANQVPLERQLATIDVLIANGADIMHKDEQGNSLLLPAVQSCPLAVVEKLVAAGAEANAANAQQFTPLKMAIVSGRWDIAGFLVDKGARMSAKEADQLFMERPRDPAQVAILERATGAAK